MVVVEEPKMDCRVFGSGFFFFFFVFGCFFGGNDGEGEGENMRHLPATMGHYFILFYS